MSIAFILMLWLSPTAAAETRQLSTSKKIIHASSIKNRKKNKNAMEIKKDTNELVVYDHCRRVIELCDDDDGQKRATNGQQTTNTTSTEAHRNGEEKCTKESKHEVNAKNSFMALWWWRNVSEPAPAGWQAAEREKEMRLAKWRRDTRNICDKEIKSRLHFCWCCARPVTSAICV